MDVRGDVGPDTDTVVLSWVKFHGRSAGIAGALEIPAIFISGGEGNLLGRYWRQWRETRRFLRRTPQLRKIVVMLPPLPALLSVSLGTTLRIAGDMHTGVFSDPKWKWALPLTMRILRKRGVGVVTNSDLANVFSSGGAAAIILHDQLTDDYVDDGHAFESEILRALGNPDWILVPLAYAYDEPLGELIEAARRTPGLCWVLTGNAPRAFRESAPANVVFPGYISDADYRRAVVRAAAIAALTTKENTMQRAGYEAMSASQALVTTPMVVLKDFFGQAALFTEPSAEGIAAAALQVVAEQGEWRGRMSAQRQIRLAEQSASIGGLRKWVKS